MSVNRIIAGLALCAASLAHAQTPATPDGLIRQLSVEVIDTVKSDKAIQAGDLNKIISLVDSKVMPHVNFQRMTASAVGRHWRGATPEQQKQLQDQSVQLKPLRAAAEDTEVVVRTEIKGKGEPIQLDYRLEKADAGWRIYDVNVLGVWLVEQYRNQFAQDINAGGIDALIGKLAERNKSAAANGTKS